MLWFGWYGFNSGSTYKVTEGISEVASLAAVNSTLSACFGGIVGLILSTILDKRVSFFFFCRCFCFVFVFVFVFVFLFPFPFSLPLTL